MDVEINTDSLKKVVSCASKATSNKAVQPILNNVLIESEKENIKISATDLDLAIECKLGANIKEPGKITLPAKKLEEIINKVSGEVINFTIDKNSLTKIKSDRSKFQINGQEATEFPEVIKGFEKKQKVVITQEELMRACDLTSFATSKFDTTSVLSGVCLKINGENFEFGATDGSRLARYVGKTKEATVKEASLVLPVRAVAELERLISVFNQEDGSVTISIQKGQVLFQGEDFTMSTRLIDGNFPEYENLIPKGHNKTAVIKRTDLLNALERVAILANERTSVVKLSFKNKSVKVSANSPDYGNADDEIDAVFTGEDLDIAFNYRYMTEVLRNLSCEEVVLELDSSLSPIILKLGDNVEYDYTYLIMPVQMR